MAFIRGNCFCCSLENCEAIMDSDKPSALLPLQKMQLKPGIRKDSNLRNVNFVAHEFVIWYGYLGRD